MILGEKINLIRKISLALFICSLLSLMGSLWLQNTLAEFDFKNTPYDEKVNISKILKNKVNCSNNIEICKFDRSLGALKVSKTLGNCFEKKYKLIYLAGNELLEHRKFLFINNEITKNNKLKPEYENKIIEVNAQFSEKIDETCIRNFKSYNLYKIFPYYHEFLYDLADIQDHPKFSLVN